MSCKVNNIEYHIDRIICQDITIIGGGSAGTYAAIRLQDIGNSVTVIEQTGRLGGNTQTFDDPITGTPIDYGVRYWHDFPEVRNYFARLNTSLVNTSLTDSEFGAVDQYFDFNSGKLNFTETSANLTDALQLYAEQLARYPYLDYGFDLPSPVPADLLLSFRDFATKYSLEPALPFLWRSTQGIDFLNLPAIYTLKLSGLSFMNPDYVTTALHDNSALYESAQRVLGDNVLYNSTVIATERSDKHGVKVIVKTCSETLLVESQKLVIAIQPTITNMQPLDLSHEERRLFKQFQNSEYFVGVLRNTGIPENITLVNTDKNQPYGVPQPPCLYSVPQTGVSGLQTVTYLSTTDSSEHQTREDIIDGLKRLQYSRDPEFAVSSIHKPFGLHVSADAIKKGFYRALYALQGKRTTWYTSATFHTQDSALIWRYTEGLLENITA